jgi:hypothetical protein
MGWEQVSIVTVGAARPPDLTKKVQDADQTMPLIAGKATALRAFVKQDGQPERLSSGIMVARGYGDGIELSSSPRRGVNPDAMFTTARSYAGCEAP